MKKLRVLVLSSLYPNNKIYRSGIFVHEQVKALIKLGVEVTVMAPVPYTYILLSNFKKKWKLYSQIPEFEIIDNINVYHSRFLALPNGLFKQFWGYIYAFNVCRILNTLEKFDLIHAHGSLPDDHAAMILSKKLNIPFALTVHGASVYSLLKYPRKFAQSKRIIKKANAVIGVSSVVNERIKKYAGREHNLFEILNGFNTVNNKNQKKTFHTKTNILFGATLVERKGCRYLLNAFKIIKKKFDSISLTIAGGGELLNDMVQLAQELKINDDVNFTGVIEHNQMLDLMSKCDIFILPSWDEAFGVVYLEAMSFKKPIIGTVGEGITDLVKDGVNGFLVHPRDVMSIVTKLSLLINSKELRERMGYLGYESIKELTWDKNAANMLQIYNSLIEG